jgi:hypothetical protein
MIVGDKPLPPGVPAMADHWGVAAGRRRCPGRAPGWRWLVSLGG